MPQRKVGWTPHSDTASSKNFDLVKGPAADEVFDYRDEGLVENVRAVTNNVLNIAIDTISEGKTPEQVTHRQWRHLGQAASGTVRLCI
jgi:NADPH:quinone reductase-like Zn-dependent oxidoreductase